MGAQEREGIILPKQLQKETLGLGLVGSVDVSHKGHFRQKRPCEQMAGECEEWRVQSGMGGERRKGGHREMGLPESWRLRCLWSGRTISRLTVPGALSHCVLRRDNLPGSAVGGCGLTGPVWAEVEVVHVPSITPWPSFSLSVFPSPGTSMLSLLLPRNKPQIVVSEPSPET